ncbi:MAG: biopolymer transporter ExbD [Verrucomicrobiales bacterium]|jgi:biopolymer transport protein ExbD|nr:biopolymer transporter ExbD [Verrucomicrobiales bacterium]MBP9223532.1 biopolymer transporter ExbD [Verrucomicrobiales bacterium]
MTRRRKAPLDEVSFQMTPMIDMTFLLLIFFMVTQRITEQELSVPVRLPVALSAASPGKTERDIINLDGEGNYYIGDRRATTEEVLAHLKVKFRDFPPLQIYLRADQKTPTKRIREFVEMATEVGAIDLIFGVFGE